MKGLFLLSWIYFEICDPYNQHLYGETVSWSLATASTAQLAIGRGSTPLGDTNVLLLFAIQLTSSFLSHAADTSSLRFSFCLPPTTLGATRPKDYGLLLLSEASPFYLSEA
jgi:hypothetical protein